jgi:ribosomal protein S6--L-glutamate ligase
MKRGKFPYAHIDLLAMNSGKYYFSEIALNGGTRGAKISRTGLDQKKLGVIKQLIQEQKRRG